LDNPLCPCEPFSLIHRLKNRQKGALNLNEELSKAAVYSIAGLKSEMPAAVLKEIILSDRPTRTREAALYAISEMDSQERRAILFKIATDNKDEKLAKTAVYALANRLAAEDKQIIIEILQTSKFDAVKKAALYASQIKEITLVSR